MTEEEIRPIAENYVEEYCHCSDGEYTDGSLVCAGIGTALIVSRQLEKRIEELGDRNAVLEKRIERAKECMKKLLFIINSDPANYNCKGLVQDAEDFIYNRPCNIRQQGEHCISETRCIMCDK